MHETGLYETDEFETADRYNTIDENLDAETVISNYDDYPQYDYDGEYEEALTGPGNPDYGQYYDYDYDSKNVGPVFGDFNDGSGNDVDNNITYSEHEGSGFREHENESKKEEDSNSHNNTAYLVHQASMAISSGTVVITTTTTSPTIESTRLPTVTAVDNNIVSNLIKVIKIGYHLKIL